MRLSSVVVSLFVLAGCGSVRGAGVDGAADKGRGEDSAPSDLGGGGSGDRNDAAPGGNDAAADGPAAADLAVGEPGATTGPDSLVASLGLYRRRIDINNNTAAALSDYQVAFNLDTASLITAGKLQSECRDIRVAQAGGTVLPIWLEKQPPRFACNSGGTRIWTRLSSVPAGVSSIYVYYGTPAAQSLENGSDVFLFFDDFSGTQAGFDSAWQKAAPSNTLGNYTVANGYLEIAGGATPNVAIAPSVGTDDYAVESDIYFVENNNTTVTANAGGVIGRYNGTGNYYHQELDQTNLNLYVFTGFNYTLLAGIASANLNSTWYRVGIKVVGAQIAATTEPQGLTVSGSNTAYPSGRPALYRWDSTMRFDNFRVRRAVVNEPSTTVTSEEPAP